MRQAFLRLDEHHFYPRPPRGGRLIRPRLTSWDGIFLSTPSARRATQKSCPVRGPQVISIHALREEGDRTARAEVYAAALFLSTPSARRATSGSCCSTCPPNNFYPRPPRGGRQIERDIYASRFQFLSTPSARRATYYGWPEAQFIKISIHALREEGDCGHGSAGAPLGYFYPRPPRGGRPNSEVGMGSVSVFLSTPSARRATRRTSSKSSIA